MEGVGVVKFRALVIPIVVMGMALFSVPAVSAAAPTLTRSAVLQELNSQSVPFHLVKVVTVSAGRDQTLTVAEGATADTPPLCRFFFWHDTTYVGQIEGVYTRISAWTRNRITLKFGDVPTSPNGYVISYSWRNGHLAASARPPVQTFGSVASSPVPTLTALPSALTVTEVAQLTATGFSGPVTYQSTSADAHLSGNEVWADAPGTYLIVATSGGESASTEIDVVASQTTGISDTGNAIALAKTSIANGQTLSASLPVSAANVFWWLTGTSSELQYPLFGSDTSTIEESIPSYIPAGEYTLSAQVNALNGQPATYTAPVTITSAPGTMLVGEVTPYDVYNRQDMMPLFRQGFEGQGQTIVLFELSDVLASDIGQFDQDFGLPAVNLQVVAPYGDPGLTDAQGEATMDVEWAHAMAPDATIVVYEYSRLSVLLDGLGFTAVSAADNGYTAMSVSYGSPNIGPILSDTQLADAATKGLAIFASSGDHGQVGLLNHDWPSDYLYVVSVGGVEYDAGGTSYWYSGPDSAGVIWAGGYGQTFGIGPVWQQQLGFDSGRMTPDVSLLAKGALEVINGITDGGGGGTSLSSPMWAGVWCLAAQYYASVHGGERIPVPAGEAIYRVAANSSQTPAFQQTYQLQTGYGAPDVENLALDLSALY